MVARQLVFAALGEVFVFGFLESGFTGIARPGGGPGGASAGSPGAGL